MIKSVTVVNCYKDELHLDLFNSHEQYGIFIKSISGIGPGKATINTVALASDDGGIFNSARLDVRNIVIDLAFYQSAELGNTIEDARHITYKYFPNKKPLTLIFETDRRTLFIEGYVESNEPNIFSNEEGCQISIICPDPKFYDFYGSGNIDFGGISKKFYFPYSNNSVSEKKTVFGVYVLDNIKNIVYSGDEETGITIYIHPKTGLSGLEIVDMTLNQSISIKDSAIVIDGTTGILSHDEITICTIKGRKNAILRRNGIEYNIMNALGRNPAWFQLVKGDNSFMFTAASGGDDLEMLISFDQAYSGV